MNKTIEAVVTLTVPVSFEDDGTDREAQALLEASYAVSDLNDLNPEYEFAGDSNVTQVCKTCGSDQVTQDALVEWSNELQQWEISSILQNADCSVCGGETRIEEQESLK